MPLNSTLGVPQNFTYSECQKHFIDILWVSVTGISQYEVLINGIVNQTVSTTSTKITGLTSNTNYDISVRSKSGSDYGSSTTLPNIRTGTYPTAVKGFTDDGYTAISTEPAHNVEYTNQVGQKERRITDRVQKGDSRNVEKGYSKTPSFNSKSEWIVTDGITSAPRDNYSTSDWNELVPDHSTSTFPSYLEPEVSYSTFENKLFKYEWDVITETETQTLLYTFTGYDPCASMPTGESKFSWDMRYVALELNKGMTGCDRTTATSYWAVVFDLQTNTIVGEKQITYVGEGYVAMSASGKYVVVLCSSNSGLPSFRVYKNDGTMNEMPYGNIQDISWLSFTGHGDTQKSIQGNDVFVCRNNGRLVMYILDTGEAVDLLDTIDHSEILETGHFGGVNSKQPGWCFAEGNKGDLYSNVPVGMQRQGYRKVFAVQLDENVQGVNNSLLRVYAKIQKTISMEAGTSPDPTGQIVAWNNFAATGHEFNHIYVAYKEGYNFLQEQDPGGISVPNIVLDEKLAFPGAFGYGKNATGGRGGQLYFVDNTNDTGFGSFRAGYEATGTRTIVIKVGGRVTLLSNLLAGAGNLTIIGQTAPGNGLTLSNYRVGAEAKSNIIVRHLTIRHGRYAVGGGTEDAFLLNDIAGSIYLDHVSVGFAMDETISIKEADTGAGGGTARVTVANSLMAQAIPSHNTASILGNNTTANIVGNYTWARNLTADISHRFPNTGGTGGIFEAYNNVISNWQSRLMRFNGDNKIDWHNNYAYAGNKAKTSSVDPYNKYSFGTGESPEIFTRQNYIDGIKTTPDDDDSETWTYFITNAGVTENTALDPTFFVTTRNSTATYPPQGLLSAVSAFSNVKLDVGHNKGVDSNGNPTDNRDNLDASYINEINTNTTVSTYQSETAWTFPTLATGTAFTDTASDGIADVFKTAHSITDGLGTKLSWDFDTYTVTNNAGYTNREIYWSYLAGDFDTLRENLLTIIPNIQKRISASQGLFINS